MYYLEGKSRADSLIGAQGMEEEESHRRKTQVERKWSCEPLRGSQEEMLG